MRRSDDRAWSWPALRLICFREATACCTIRTAPTTPRRRPRSAWRQRSTCRRSDDPGLDLKQGMIVDALGIPEGTAKVRLHRAHVRLRHALSSA